MNYCGGCSAKGNEELPGQTAMKLSTMSAERLWKVQCLGKGRSNFGSFFYFRYEDFRKHVLKEILLGLLNIFWLLDYSLLRTTISAKKF